MKSDEVEHRCGVSEVRRGRGGAGSLVEAAKGRRESPVEVTRLCIRGEHGGSRRGGG